jgi:tetratricopeptide (TPR) repeat protein
VQTNSSSLLWNEHYELMRGGNLRAARDVLTDNFETLVIDDPNHFWYCDGDAMYRLGNYRAARVSFLKALKYCASDPLAMWALADCRLRQERLTPVLVRLLSARKLLRDSAEVSELLFDIANVYADMSLPRHAERFYLRAMMRQPKRELRYLIIDQLKKLRNHAGHRRRGTETDQMTYKFDTTYG